MSRTAARETLRMMEITSAHKELLADSLFNNYVSGDNQAFFDILPVMFCITDFDGHLLSMNGPRWKERLGYTEEELRKGVFFDIVHPKDMQKTERMYEHIKGGGVCDNWENRYLTKWGHYIRMHWFCAADVAKKVVICMVYSTPIIK